VPHLQAMLADTGLNPGCLKIEITESTLIHDTAAMLETLTRIKATGVKLSMDDFGTGYSSLSCLHQFPIDVLKIDRSFVIQIQDLRSAAGVVHGIVALAHGLGMQVVAEGLETKEQVAFLQAVDCDLGQGYFFAKPLPHALAEQMVAEQRAIKPMAA
jgi:EAL domain-containing protein (putative c-di-GMP-specific phosphodiesterase class I)